MTTAIAEPKEKKRRTRRNFARDWADLETYLQAYRDVLSSEPDTDATAIKRGVVDAILARMAR